MATGTKVQPKTVPVLVARPGGPAERLSHALSDRHPALVFLIALLSGFLLLAAASCLLALFVVHVLAGDLGLATTDQNAVESVVDQRSGTLTTISEIGSQIGGAPVLPILVGLIGIAFAIKRRWRIAAFAVFVLVVESATYRVASVVVPRDRPHVHRLEDLPADASYPSGHTAASLAVYCGLVLLLTSAFPKGGWRVAAWVVALLLPVFVAFSRMYRGMHHPLDTGAGVLIGIGALLVLLFACRAAGVAALAHAPGRTRARSSSRRPRTVA